MTAPLDVTAVRSEWADVAEHGFPSEKTAAANRIIPALVDHIDVLVRALRQIAFTEVHSPSDFARTILEETVAS